MKYLEFEIKTKSTTSQGNSRRMFTWEYFGADGFLIEESADEFNSREEAIEDCKQFIDDGE